MFVLTTLSTSACGQHESSAPVYPEASFVPASVLLISIDTLRADHVSAYGYRLTTSPEVDRLAERGSRFEFAFSASACTAPSTTSILTGRYPSFHSVGVLNGHYVLDPQTPTLATILREHGYRTGAVIGNPVLRSHLGLDIGFEFYDDDIEGRELNRKNTPERRADRMVDIAADWLVDHDGRPYFLWLHFQDPHGPYTPADDRFVFEGSNYSDETVLRIGDDQSGLGAIPRYQRYLEERRVADYMQRYDAEIAYMDHQIGRLIRILEDQGQLTSTLVVLTADHGEAMGEDGYYFGHSHSVGLDQVRVPLIIAGPGVPDGRVIRVPVSNISVMESILEELGFGYPGDIERRSLFALAREGEDAGSPVFFESPNQSGVVFGNTFFRRDRRSPEDTAFWSAGNPNTGGAWRPLGRQVLRPLDADTVGLALQEDPALEKMLNDFDRRATRAREAISGDRIPARLSPRQVERLRALGYFE
jgi:arylsulfatase